jgi:ABC-type branched-subunit amino acid transport system substrate-binding protein
VVASTVRVRQDEQDLSGAVTQLRNARCDAVLLVSLPRVTERLLGAASQTGFETRWIALVPGWHASLAQSPLARYYERNLWVVWDGPEWGDTTVTGMRNMLDAQRRFRPTRQPDIYHLTGWAMGRVVHLALEKAASLSDMSRAGILRAVSEMGNVTFEGLLGTYQYGPPETREPPRTSTIFRVNAGKPVGLEAVALHYVSAVALEYRFTSTSR